MLNPHKILISDGTTIRKRQGRRFHRAVNRPPYIHQPDPSLEQLISLVGQMVVHALFGGRGGLVDVGALDRAAFRVGDGAADGVVEDQHPLRGPGQVVEEQALDFGVVVALHGGVVGEGPFRGEADVGQGGEGVGVEGVGGFGAADVGDEGGGGGVGEVALGFAWGWGFDVVVGAGAVGGGEK